MDIRNTSSAPVFDWADVGIELDRADLDYLFSVTYEELRRLAATVRRGDPHASLNPTALVNEAWVTLARSPRFKATSILHFKRIAARAMRQREGGCRRGVRSRVEAVVEAAVRMQSNEPRAVDAEEADAVDGLKRRCNKHLPIRLPRQGVHVTRKARRSDHGIEARVDAAVRVQPCDVRARRPVQ